MTLDATAEIDFMLSEQGQDATIAGVTAKAILDTTDLGLLAGELTEVDAGLVVFTAKTGAFPGLAIGVDLVSDATTYKIRQFLRVGDGETTQIFCQGPGQVDIFGEADVDAMLEESPVSATIAGVTAKVIFEPVGDSRLEGEGASIQATKILLTAKTGKFPGLQNGASILIGATTYKAVDVKRSGDGALSIAVCGIVS